MFLTDNQRRSLLFYLLNTEYKKKQIEIASFLNVHQSTVSNGIKEAKYLLQLNEARKELEVLRNQLIHRIGEPPEHDFW